MNPVDWRTAKHCHWRKAAPGRWLFFERGDLMFQVRRYGAGEICGAGMIRGEIVGTMAISLEKAVTPDRMGRGIIETLDQTDQVRLWIHEEELDALTRDTAVMLGAVMLRRANER